MKKIIFLYVLSSIFFSFSIYGQNIPNKLDGEYCDRAGNIMAYCMSFKGDTFRSGILSMMFNYVGKGTYTLNNDSLTLYYCKGDSSRYVDGTVPPGTVKKYFVKKITETELVIKDTEKKDITKLKKEKK